MKYFIITFSLYLVFVVALYFGQRHVMYFPDKNVVEPAVKTYSTHLIKSPDGVENTAWYYTAKNNKPTILFTHGNAGDIADRDYKAVIFNKAGYGVLLVGYRGFGNNPGTPSEDGFYQDTQAQLSWLKETHNIAIDNIIFYGESIGTGPATEMATRHPNAKALILETPFNSIAAVSKYRFPFVPFIKHMVRDKFDNQSKMPYINMPILIGLAGKDRTVPDHFGQALYDVATDPKTILRYPDAGHIDLYDYDFGSDVIKFIETQ